jgi:hypothetical protein
MSEKPEEKQPNGYPAEATRGVTQLRETAKWIVGIFGALGAALIAGTQLAGLGKLEAPERLVPAAVAAGVGLFCVGSIIWAAARVLTTGDVTLAELAQDERKWISEDKPSRWWWVPGGFPDINYIHQINVLGDFPKVQDLRDETSQIEALRLQAMQDRKIGWTNGTELPGAAAQDARDRYNKAKADLERRTPIHDREQAKVLAAAKYARVRWEFKRTVWVLLGFGATAAIALGVFAWAVNPPAPEAAEAPEFRVPVEGLLRLDDEERRRELAAGLGGDTCTERDINVIVLSSTDENADIVTVPREGCSLARLTVERVEVLPREAVDLSAP